MLAEDKSWDYAKKLGVEMVSLHLTNVWGPPLSPLAGGLSVKFIKMLMDRSGSGMPYAVIHGDVRTVGEAHIAAAEVKKAAGQRYIISDTDIGE